MALVLRGPEAEKGRVAMPATVTPEFVEKTILNALLQLGLEPANISRDLTFETLDVDSLDLIELAQVIEEEYRVALNGDDLAEISTIGEAVDLVVSRAG
jgi:acyl carrier protein